MHCTSSKNRFTNLKKKHVWKVGYGMFNLADYLLHQVRGIHDEIDRREKRKLLEVFQKGFFSISEWHHYWSDSTVMFIIQFSNKKIFKNLKTIRTRIQDVQICFSRPYKNYFFSWVCPLRHKSACLSLFYTNISLSPSSLMYYSYLVNRYSCQHTS